MRVCQVPKRTLASVPSEAGTVVLEGYERSDSGIQSPWAASNSSTMAQI
jgi:hypothetical protein